MTTDRLRATGGRDPCTKSHGPDCTGVQVPALGYTEGRCLHAASTRAAAAWGEVRISHSHSRTTAHPACSAVVVACWSLSWVRVNFCPHSAAFGPAGLRSGKCTGQPCQKSPSTNTATCQRGRTRSAVQACAIRRCSRNLAPAACRARRSSTSGAVSRDRRPLSAALREVATHCCPTGPVCPPRRRRELAQFPRRRKANSPSLVRARDAARLAGVLRGRRSPGT